MMTQWPFILTEIKVLAVDMPAEEQENNLYYAGVSAGAPKEAKLELTKEQIQQYVKEGKIGFLRKRTRRRKQNQSRFQLRKSV